MPSQFISQVYAEVGLLSTVYHFQGVSMLGYQRLATILMVI